MRTIRERDCTVADKGKHAAEMMKKKKKKANATQTDHRSKTLQQKNT